jgi:DNA-binding IclR family transcriptional regulator
LEGIHCVSSVILDDYEFPVGAITTIAPAFRLPPDRFEEIGQACMESAGMIRKGLFQ